MKEQTKKPTSQYALKHRQGCEMNHRRHPASGVPWCENCKKEKRGGETQ